MPSRSLLVGAALLAAPVTASAQTEAGRVVDDSTNVVVRRILVSLERAASDGWTAVDTTRTDFAGLFQFGALQPGIYRVAFLLDGKAYPGPADTLASGSFTQRQYFVPAARVARATGRAFFGSLDIRSAEPARAGIPIPYPAELANTGIRTAVVAQFVVKPDGRADLATLRILGELPHRAFGDAVHAYLTSAKFRPASIAGRRVRQVVQQEFVFTP